MNSGHISHGVCLWHISCLSAVVPPVKAQRREDRRRKGSEQEGHEDDSTGPTLKTSLQVLAKVDEKNTGASRGIAI